MLLHSKKFFGPAIMISAICISLQIAMAAENWNLLGNNMFLKVNVYYKNEHQKTGQFPTAYILYSYHEKNRDQGIPHRSEIENVQIDCDKSRVKLLDVKWHSKNMGVGPVVFNTKNLNWQNFEVGTVYNDVKSEICR